MQKHIYAYKFKILFSQLNRDSKNYEFDLWNRLWLSITQTGLYFQYVLGIQILQLKGWAKDSIPTIYSSGTSISPLLTSSMTSWGGLLSTVHPTDWQVPRISLTVPLSVRDMDRGLMARAMLRTSSNERLPLCLTFLTFLRSLGGSFRALMTRDAADGTTDIVACLFWMVSCTVILRPFQSLVALAMSSPTFFGDCRIKQNDVVN